MRGGFVDRCRNESIYARCRRMHKLLRTTLERGGDDIACAENIGSSLAVVVARPRAEIGGRMKNSIYSFRNSTLYRADVADIAHDAADVKAL